MKNVKKQVRNFRKEFKIKGIPDMSEIRQVIRSFHYQLLTYEGNEELLQKLGQYERSRYVPSFCCTKNRQNYLFFSAEIHDRDLPYVLAHEIGHIYMNHLNREENIHDTPEYKDREVNEFASQLMQEQKSKFSLKLPLAVLMLSLALLVCSISFHNITEFITPVKTAITQISAAEESPAEDTADESVDIETVPVVKQQIISTHSKVQATVPEQSTENTNQEQQIQAVAITETVVVTKTGKRYHTPTCWHLYNREGLRNIPLEQAITEKYTPCSDCFK